MRFEPNNYNSSDYSEDGIILEIQRVINKHFSVHAPTRAEFFKQSRIKYFAIQKKFGSYKQAVEKAGFANEHIRVPRKTFGLRGADGKLKKYSVEQIKDSLKKVYAKTGTYFTQSVYRKNGGTHSHKTIRSILGVKSWEDALKTIGIKKQRRIIDVLVSPWQQRRRKLANLTNEDLFKEIERIWKKINGRPTYDQFRKNSPFGTKVYESKFGSWTKAIDAFLKSSGKRIQGTGGTRVTKEMLIDELKLICPKRSDDLFTFELYRTKGGTYSITTFQKYFGSWANAVKTVGNISGRKAAYSIDELFDEMQRLWEYLGRQPSFQDMGKLGNISGGSYQSFFGSWKKAVIAFCADRSNELVSSIPETLTTIKKKSDIRTTEVPTVFPNKEQDSLIVVHQTPRICPDRLRWKVFSRDNFKCKVCGRSPANEFNVELHVDHIKAWSKGGETVLENLQTLCRLCNSGKSDL